MYIFEKYFDDGATNDILKILKNEGKSNYGIICFKCGSRRDIPQFTDIIRKLDYCHFFDYEGDEYLNVDNPVISVASFDTESG